MAHLPLSRVRSWTNGMRCMSFYILTRLWYLESISNRDTTVLHQAFQDMLNHGFVTGFQLKAHKLFAKWALEPWINECKSTGLELPHVLNRLMILIMCNTKRSSFVQALDALEQHCYCGDQVWNVDKQLNTINSKLLCWELDIKYNHEIEYDLRIYVSDSSG